MATLTAPRPASKARTAKPAAPDVCRLSATIRGESYGVRILDPSQSFGVVGLVRLRKAGTGETYHVASHCDSTITCECGDYHFRHEGNGRGTTCKHGRARKAMGL